MIEYMVTRLRGEPVTVWAWSDEGALDKVRGMHRVTEVFRRTSRGYERIAA